MAVTNSRSLVWLTEISLCPAILTLTRHNVQRWLFLNTIINLFSRGIHGVSGSIGRYQI